MKNKRLLVTGSSGFVGKHLCNELQSQGFETLKFDISEGQNILNYKHLEQIGKVDIVFHLAALTYVPYSYDNPRENYEINVLGTLNILEYCRKYGAKIIFASSYVYGEPTYLPIDEKHPIGSFNPYSSSKIIGEKLCESFNRDFSVQTVILRPFNIYGINQSKEFLIPTIINQASTGEIILDDPRPKRDFIHIYDVVEAYLKAALYESENLEVFNIGSGFSHSVEEVSNLIRSSYSKKPILKFRNIERKKEVFNVYADISKAKEILGWSPKIKLEKGLKQLVEYEDKDRL